MTLHSLPVLPRDVSGVNGNTFENWFGQPLKDLETWDINF